MLELLKDTIPYIWAIVMTIMVLRMRDRISDLEYENENLADQVNNLYKNDDFWRKYQEFSCLNAGTLDSFCTSEQEDRLVEECDYRCEDGECKDRPEKKRSVRGAGTLNILEESFTLNNPQNVVNSGGKIVLGTYEDEISLNPEEETEEGRNNFLIPLIFLIAVFLIIVFIIIAAAAKSR